MIIYNKDKDTRKLEKEALLKDKKSFELLNDYYYSNFNDRTGDMNIFCYEYELKKIIENAKIESKN